MATSAGGQEVRGLRPPYCSYRVGDRSSSDRGRVAVSGWLYWLRAETTGAVQRTSAVCVAATKPVRVVWQNSTFACLKL